MYCSNHEQRFGLVPTEMCAERKKQAWSPTNLTQQQQKKRAKIPAVYCKKVKEGYPKRLTQGCCLFDSKVMIPNTKYM